MPVASHFCSKLQFSKWFSMEKFSKGNVNPPAGSNQKPKCIIMAPTRELASQIYDDAYKLCGKNTGVVPRLVYGGTS